MPGGHASRNAGRHAPGMPRHAPRHAGRHAWRQRDSVHRRSYLMFIMLITCQIIIQDG